MSKIIVTGQLTLTGGQLTTKETPVPPEPAGPNLWAWGNNSIAGPVLGLGDIIDRSSPVAIGALTTWTTNVSIGSYHAGAIKTDGTLWVWGDNGTLGKLGLGDAGADTDRSSPVQLGSLTDWNSLEFGSNHSLAVKTDNTLWVWGLNSKGQLGQGDTVNRSSPVQVTGTTWADVGAGSGTGVDHTMAVKTDGTLWAWGDNLTYGELGLGDLVRRSSPVQVGGLTTWSKVQVGTSSTLALKTDGTIWSWGNNSFGRLGHGNTINQSSPVQIGTLTTWTDISFHGVTALAINSSNELWSWGGDFNGVLGVGTSSIHQSSPVQVGSDTNWSTIAQGGDQHAHATRTDGTLWSWGEGQSGKLGLGDVADRNSPVQVGSLTNWIKAIAGGKSAFGLK